MHYRRGAFFLPETGASPRTMRPMADDARIAMQCTFPEHLALLVGRVARVYSLSQHLLHEPSVFSTSHVSPARTIASFNQSNVTPFRASYHSDSLTERGRASVNR